MYWRLPSKKTLAYAACPLNRVTPWTVNAQTRIIGRVPKALASRQERRADTRRKILVGAVVLAKIDQGVFEASVLRGWLDGALTRPDDRALFGLNGNKQEPT